MLASAVSNRILSIQPTMLPLRRKMLVQLRDVVVSLLGRMKSNMTTPPSLKLKPAKKITKSEPFTPLQLHQPVSDSLRWMNFLRTPHLLMKPPANFTVGKSPTSSMAGPRAQHMDARSLKIVAKENLLPKSWLSATATLLLSEYTYVFWWEI